MGPPSIAVYVVLRLVDLFAALFGRKRVELVVFAAFTYLAAWVLSGITASGISISTTSWLRLFRGEIFVPGAVTHV